MQACRGEEALNVAQPSSRPRLTSRTRVLLKWIILVSCMAIAVTADLLTKHWAEQNLKLGEVDKILPFFYLQRSANNGIAFGLFGGHTYAIVAVNIIAFLLILAFVVWWRSWVLAGISGGLIMGGFLGNLVQRVSGQKMVTDFLKFPHWPNFNLADLFLVLGICLIVLGLGLEVFQLSRPEKTRGDGG